MSSSNIEILARETLDEFYLQRLTKLSEVKLRDLLRKKNLYLLCATNGHPVPKIIEKMLEEYLSQSDESIFGQTLLESIASIEREETTFSGEKSNIACKVITLMNLMRNYSIQNQREFDKEWAKALN